MTLGFLLDVSGSMQDALEVGRGDGGAVDRVQAVLRTALKIARTEHQKYPGATMFVGAFGMKSQRNPVVDLCGLLEALVDTVEDDRSGRELLIKLAERSDMGHIADYIQTKLTDEKAYIVYVYLRRHPEKIQEFIDMIPSPRKRRTSKVAFTVAKVLSATVLGGADAGLLKDSLSAGKDNLIDNSEAMQQTNRIWKDWWSQFANLNARPVADVVSLLERLHNRPEGDSAERDRGPSSGLGTIRQYIYGRTPMRRALKSAQAAFIRNRGKLSHEQDVLILISDGASTDGDPVEIARELSKNNIQIATIFLTSEANVLFRTLYDKEREEWVAGQRDLYHMATVVDAATHPIPVLALMGWKIPNSGACSLHASVSSAEALDEFGSLVVAARFGSADALLEVIGRVNLDAYVNDDYLGIYKTPSNQGSSATCYAHAVATVVHMALDRIVGYRGGHPSIREIRARIKEKFPPKAGGQPTETVLREACRWYPPLQYQKVDETGARQAVLRRRPVLSIFNLSDSGWKEFCNRFEPPASTASEILTMSVMQPHINKPRAGGHAVLLTKVDPHSLTFLNSWGRDWGRNGSFGIESPEVLEANGLTENLPMQFFDVFWLESELLDDEKLAFRLDTKKWVHERAPRRPSVFELECRCPECGHNSPIKDFRGSIFAAICPRCHKSFRPEPDHLVRAIYARAGFGEVVAQTDSE